MNEETEITEYENIRGWQDRKKKQACYECAWSWQ
jgi:hypothetical protein